MVSEVPSISTMEGDRWIFLQYAAVLQTLRKAQLQELLSFGTVNQSNRKHNSNTNI